MSARVIDPGELPWDTDKLPAMADDFKAAMRRLAASVTIITASSAGMRHGMTATAVTSLTASPPSLLVCVNQSASIQFRPEHGLRLVYA